MSLGGVSFGQLLVVFLIIALLFGTKKLRAIGEDLGHAVHGFKKGLREGNASHTTEHIDTHQTINQTDKSSIDVK